MSAPRKKSLKQQLAETTKRNLFLQRRVRDLEVEASEADARLDRIRELWGVLNREITR